MKTHKLTNLSKINFKLILLFIFFNINISSASADNLESEFKKHATKGAWHEIDSGPKATYDAKKEYTAPVYRQLSSLPNLEYIKLPQKSTYFTEDMGMSAYEISPKGEVLWSRRIQGETYYGIAPINQDEILLSVLNKSHILKINKKNGIENVFISGDYRDIQIKNGNVILVQNSKNGKAQIFSLSGKILWSSIDNFFWARGVWQKNNKNILVADFKNKIYEIDFKTRKIIWTFNSSLYYPNSIQEMHNGNYLVADEHNNRVIEIDPHRKKIINEFSNGLYSPNCAVELANKDLLICDTDNHRIIQIDKEKRLIWQVSNVHAPNKVFREE
jgi:hypothetical protein